MRHSADSPTYSQAGFTLLEITVVLFIIVLLIGIGTLSFGSLSAEETLRRPAAELEAMARDAVRRAGIYEEPQFILFDKSGFSMRYRTDASALDNGPANQMWTRHTDVPANMRLFLKRWGARDWKPAAGQEWQVLPSGLCEPVCVRMEMGTSYIEMEFNPLTGGIMDQQMSIVGT